MRYDELIKELEKYGIHSEADLDRALKNMKIDIGMFVNTMKGGE